MAYDKERAKGAVFFVAPANTKFKMSDQILINGKASSKITLTDGNGADKTPHYPPKEFQGYYYTCTCSNSFGFDMDIIYLLSSIEFKKGDQIKNIQLYDNPNTFIENGKEFLRYKAVRDKKPKK